MAACRGDAVLPLTALAVYSVGVGRWQRTLTRLSSLKKAPASDGNVATVRATEKSVAPEDERAAIQKARVIAKIVRSAARRGIYHANCLEQSLVLWWLLALRNIESQLRFGARKENAQLEAHAWVVYCGVSLNEEADVHERFSPFIDDLLSGRDPENWFRVCRMVSASDSECEHA